MSITNCQDGESINVSELVKSQLDSFFSSVTVGVGIVDVVGAINLPFITERIVHKHSLYCKDGMVRLYLVKKLLRIRKYYRFVSVVSERSQVLGLNALPTKRCFNKFLLKVDVRLLDLIVEEVLSYCLDKDVVDIKIVSSHSKKCRTVSEDSLFEDAVKMVKRFVYPLIVIPIRNNTSLTTKDVLDVLVHIASDNSFCFDGTKKFQYQHKDKHLPRGDTILYHLSKLDKNYIREVSDKVFNTIFRFGKRECAMLRNRKADIAFDVHEIPYYGNEDNWFVSGGKFQNGTSYFYKFVTCSMVVSGRRFTLDVQPLAQYDSLKKILDNMLVKVKRHVHIGIIYMDRGFDRTNIYNVLKKHHVKYVMPKILTPTVKQWMDKAEGAPAYIVNNFKIGSKKEVAYINLVLVDDDEGIKRAFATNLRIGRQIAHKLYYLYSKRWGIETAYRQMDKDFKPRTTSNNYNLRLLYFFFTVILFNFWVLVNMCISLKKYGKIRDKPVISGKLFLAVLITVQIDVG